MTSLADDRLHVPFRSRSLASLAEFTEFTREVQPILDARYLHERTLASAADSISFDGTCAPCLRRARFSARTHGGDILPDGRRVPNWREELHCDCEDRLNNRSRALLHFLETDAGLRSWSRVLLFGPPATADRRIAAAAGVSRLSRLGLAPGGGHRLDAGDAGFHLAITADYLHRVPPLGAALAELRRVLVPGGRLVFTVPFHDRSATTVSRTGHLPRLAGRLPGEAGADTHQVGWDILDMLRAAGFADARAFTYWSEELGYLGPFNMIFSATA
jgi:SAM-dependent methyltransferase